MDELEELSSHLVAGSKVIVITEKNVDLRAAASGNWFFSPEITEGSLSAGGHGGLGEPKVVRVFCLSSKVGSWTKLFETQDGSSAADFELP